MCMQVRHGSKTRCYNDGRPCWLLRVSGDKAQIILSLLETQSSFVFLSEKFEGDGKDQFQFVDDLSDKVSNALRVQLNSRDAERIEHIEENMLSASELRSSAAQLFHKASAKDFSEAERLLERALTLDPDNPTTLSMMCLAKLWQATAKFQKLPYKDVEWIAEAADAAISKAPRNYFVFFVRSQFHLLELKDTEGVRQDVNRTLQLNSGYSWGLETLGLIELSKGNYSAAMGYFSDVVDQSQSDPILPRRLFWQAFSLTLERKLVEARGAIEVALEMWPDYAPHWRLLSHILLGTGDVNAADGVAERAQAPGLEQSMFF